MQEEPITSEDTYSEVFKRQLAIQGWNQKAVTSQVALVLGAGGLGSCVSIQLVRLGIGKVILVDYDVVDTHNLNRQIMYTTNDVGKSKVQQAKENLQFHNVGNTIIEAHHFDAVKEWGKIVQLAKQSTLIFNLIDYGDYFDIAINSLSRALHLPIFQGGTFCNSLSVDYFPADVRPCLLCLTDGLKPDLIKQLSPTVIESYTSIEFIDKNNNPPGQSNIVICQMCANFINTFVLTELMPSDKKKSQRFLLYLDPIDVVQFNLEQTPKCPYCREPFIEKYCEVVTTSNQIEEKTLPLWKNLKVFALINIFGSQIQELKQTEGDTIVDGQWEILFKDKTKWTVNVLEISGLHKQIVFDMVSASSQLLCKKIRHTLLAKEEKDKKAKLVWKIEFLDDVPISYMESMKAFVEKLVFGLEITPEGPKEI